MGKPPVTDVDEEALSRDRKKALPEEQYDRIFRLYTLAEKLQDTSAKNAGFNAT